MRSRIIPAALALALLTTLALVVTASAAPLAPNTLQPNSLKMRLLGTNKIAASAKLPSDSADQATSRPNPGNRPIPGKSAGSSLNAPQSAPTVTPLTLDTTGGGATTVKGLNAYDSRITNGFNLTPPDQGLCAGNGYVLEPVNDVVAVYDSNLNKVSPDMTLNSFLLQPASMFVGDPKCYYDPIAQGWFVTSFALDQVNNTAAVAIAVSQSSNPNLGWNIYMLDVTDTGASDSPSGCPCFGDQPLIGANRDAFFISTNEYSINGPQFYGTNLYAFDKAALAMGSSTVNSAFIRVGQIPTPDGSCTGSNATCWYSLQPATSPVRASWDRRKGGSEYFLSALDFTGAGDSRIALWAVTNTKTIVGQSTPNLTLSEVTLNSEAYMMPPNGVQKDDHKIPAGKFYYNATSAGQIATNDDRMNQTVFVRDSIWGAVNTAVNVPNVKRSFHAGIAWFSVRPNWSTGALDGKILSQGYVATESQDVMFPSVGLNGAAHGIMAFSLSGPGYYPTSAFVRLGQAITPTQVSLSAIGQGSLDDFCEYAAANCPGTDPPSAGPRFGDYSAAVASNGQIYFASEYVQYANCNLDTFRTDHFCNATRGNRTNWGTSLSKITP